ncbi:hypothetical protein HanPSC8_Chr10g0418371 [Helianthus annuus]|nr:hypothetical protein HanPSC8_Chr10g0418371 [Helianthus annuus]
MDVRSENSSVHWMLDLKAVVEMDVRSESRFPVTVFLLLGSIVFIAGLNN